MGQTTLAFNFDGLSPAHLFICCVILPLIVGQLAGMIWAIVDVWKSQRPENEKLLWTILVVVSGIIGVIIYYFVGRKTGRPPTPSSGGDSLSY